MLEGHLGAVAVRALAAEPFAEEAFLCLALVREIAPKERTQCGVYSVVEPVDQRIDRGPPADTGEEITAGQGAMSLAMSQESTMLHTLPTITNGQGQSECECESGRAEKQRFG
jgi:hypothetical protein